MNSCRFDQLTYFYQHVSLAYSIEASCLLFLQVYAPLLAAFTTQAKSEINLLVKVQVNLKIYCFFLVQFFHSLIWVYLLFLLQEYCYDNMSFMKVFQKMVMLFYKSKKRGKTVLLFWGIFLRQDNFIQLVPERYGNIICAEHTKTFVSSLRRFLHARFIIFKRAWFMLIADWALTHQGYAGSVPILYAIVRPVPNVRPWGL